MKRMRLFQLAGILFFIVFFPELVFSETILLKSKQSITKQILDRTPEYITVDFQETVLKLYMVDIESIDGEKVMTPLEKEISASLQGDAELSRKLEEADKENKQLIQKVEKLQEELAGLYMNFKKDNNIIEEKDKIILELKDEVEIMSQKDKDSIVKFKSANEEITRLNEELNSFRNSIVSSKDADMEGLKEPADTDRDILSMEEKTKKMIEDYTDLFQQKDKIISELKEEIKNIKQKGEAPNKRLDDAQKEISKLKGDMESLQDTVVSKEEAIKNKGVELEKIKKMNDEYTGLFRQKEEAIVKLKEESNAIKQKDEVSSKQLDDAQKEISKLKGDMESLQNTAAVNEEIVKKSKEEAEKDKKLILNLKSEIESFTKKSQGLIEELRKGTNGE